MFLFMLRHQLRENQTITCDLRVARIDVDVTMSKFLHLQFEAVHGKKADQAANSGQAAA
jgi:hypothetical protein